ncbi:MAG TPA: oligosaccharide flippase family protein [Patescibacteria group bacterium]|nr:oligosaccharide flippase family protein [Patescibacteria group bacterium]
MKEKAKAALLRVQKVTRTDMVYAAKGGFWLSFGSAAGSLMSLAVAIVFANLASKDAYGYYKYLMSIGGALAGFTLTGLGEALLRSAAKNYDGTLRALARRSFRWNVLVGAVALAGAGWYFWRGDAKLGWSLVAIGVFMPMTQSTSLFAAFLRGKKDFRTSSAYGLLRTAAPSAALIASLLLLPHNPAILVTASVGTGALATYAAYRLTLKRHAKNDAVDPGAMAFGAHVSFMNAIGTLAVNLDKILIFQFFGAAPTAVYALAQALPEQLDGVTSNLRSLATPKFAEQSPSRAFGPLLRKTAIVMLIMIPLVGVAMLFTPLAYRLVFPQYHDAARYALVLLVAQVFVTPSHLPLAFIMAHHDLRGRYIAGLGPSFVFIALLLVLIKPFGLMGVAVAKIVTKAVGLALALVFAARISARQPLPSPDL